MADVHTPAGGDDPFLLVGRIRKPHGVRGELFVWLETDRPAEVFVPGRVLWFEDALEGPDRLTIERARPFKDGFLIKPSEFGVRNEALESLRGRPLHIRRSEAAPLDADEVFRHDLIGLRVIAAGEVVGTVHDVLDTPGPDLLEVRRAGRPELLIPFVREMVVRVDPAEGVLEIAPPEGLLEL
jgi:16S rRNA processing protein RimM